MKGTVGKACVVVAALLSLVMAGSAGFAADFDKRFGRKPDAWAAQGYDALFLLVEAMKQAGSIDPEVVVTPGIFVDRILDLSADRRMREEAS